MGLLGKFFFFPYFPLSVDFYFYFICQQQNQVFFLNWFKENIFIFRVCCSGCYCCCCYCVWMCFFFLSNSFNFTIGKIQLNWKYSVFHGTCCWKNWCCCCCCLFCENNDLQKKSWLLYILNGNHVNFLLFFFNFF
jgi:hypothetical protein